MAVCLSATSSWGGEMTEGHSMLKQMNYTQIKERVGNISKGCTNYPHYWKDLPCTLPVFCKKNPTKTTTGNVSQWSDSISERCTSGFQHMICVGYTCRCKYEL